MTTPFAFVPRAVVKYTKPWQGISRSSPSCSPSPHEDVDEDSEPSTTVASSSLDKAKGKEKVVEPAHSSVAQDIASIISLALSDYNIWHDADLRWKLDACLKDDTSPDDAGFVPINYLLRRPPFRGSLQSASDASEPSETEVVKALRAHASHILEVRMRLPVSSSAPSSSVWYGTGKTSRKKDVGGYEVRRRDWKTLHHRVSRGWSHARWDDVTLYMECIPPPYRTIGGIARFAEALLFALSKPETSTAPCLHIQCITLPPHYLDKPGDTPKCKGYALVTFSTKVDAEAIVRTWPWKRRPVLVTTHEHDAHDNGDEGWDGDVSPAVKEAHKYGFRAISKVRWDALNEEYLLYKQRIVDDMAHKHHPLDEDTAEHDGSVVPARPDMAADTPTETTLASPYPFDCLVFVRNVHPETNKTTLKSLFGQALQDGDGSGQGSGHGQARLAAGIDYVDYIKNMDTCHLRLASPNHASQLVAYFDARWKAQAHGLDATGTAPVSLADGALKPIAMERIRGKKEELYWDKVPEKIRRQAVNKVVKARATVSPSAGAELSHRNGIREGRPPKRSREA